MLTADIKRVYVLGAGSSIAHTKGQSPAINDFFSKATELDIITKKEYAPLVLYAKNTLGQNILSKRDKTNIESFYTHIEIELERTSSVDLLKIRQQLLQIIQEVLISLEERNKGSQGNYNNFFNRLHPNNTIITFNWDLLLDNILKRNDILKDRYEIDKNQTILSGQYWQFISKATGFGEMTMEGIGIDKPYFDWAPSKNGFYLKLHGSIDWYYCSNEGCRAARRVFPTLEIKKPIYCSECHEPLESLIIPPILNKEYKKYPVIRRIWNIAAKEISSADELIIWGYSLPPTDFYSQWLIRQVRTAPLARLVIINPSVRSDIRKKTGIGFTFVRRFYDLLRDKLSKDKVYLFESFYDYENDLDIINKYSLSQRMEVMRNL